jgi:2-oxo-4-hydroxy-4-carboxy-5-ureidoimidazoline decarboxylase
LIYKALAGINEMPAEAAEVVFLRCCGSHEWARRMAAERPFRLLTYLFETGEEIWFSLGAADHLEAFAAQPRLDVVGAEDDIKRQLADVTHLYETKFGFIFVISTTGRSADELLAICRARIGNSVETELKLAAIEQWKITELRLNKLLEE